MSLIKSKLIQNITEANPHLFIRDVERIVNTIFNEITQSLADGKRVELRGFGAFSVQHRNSVLAETQELERLLMLKKSIFKIQNRERTEN